MIHHTHYSQLSIGSFIHRGDFVWTISLGSDILIDKAQVYFLFHSGYTKVSITVSEKKAYKS